MAETVANALIEEIISKLISMVANEIGLAWGFKRQLRKLQNTLVGIQNVLEEAETRQVMEKNVKKWLMSLKDVAYEADDILDENTTEILRRKFELGSRIKKVS
ncbi:PREDICTED: putative disease resistance protein RGA3 [Nelumbo nucifera]|uniref:Disease resistance protein RGA3 n=1 Tax=Nelumbo nucifera TaxID=4432 RepID=A0A1U7YW68_NELNU|nr:PREDICTED: putative disease resistance protein RGA3 [Nelumbo nucifera]